MTSPRPLSRVLRRYLADPLSVRNAMLVIITATLTCVVLGGILIRLAEPSKFTTIWIGMWWALQTVTTVGYGDISPSTSAGRLIAAVVMLTGVAFLAIVTASITSSFVNRMRRQVAARHPGSAIDDAQAVAARLDAIAARLDRIEETLRLSREPDRTRPENDAAHSGEDDSP